MLKIVHNDQKKGIELYFTQKLPKGLAKRLTTIGFKQGRGESLKWYAPQHPAFETYAAALKEVLTKGEDFQTIQLQPSFEPSVENIDHNKFSYVTISYSKDEIKYQDNYVVFDSYKTIATQLAIAYGKQLYGAHFIEVDVAPRNYKRKSRALLAEGKVITNSGFNQTKPTTEASSPKKITPKEKLAILTGFGKFHQKQKEAFPEVEISEEELPIQFNSWLRQQYPELLSQKDSIWDEYLTVQQLLDTEAPQIPEKDYRLFYTRFIAHYRPKVEEILPLENFVQWLEENYANLNKADKAGLIQYYTDFLSSLKKNKEHLENLSKPKKQQPYSSIYNKLHKLIPDLKEHLDNGYYSGKSSLGIASGLMDLSLNVIDKDEQGRYTIALSHYYEENRDLIADPDMQIRIDFEQEMAEALTFQDRLTFMKVYHVKQGKVMVDFKQKKAQNKFLSTWLTNLINDQHKIVWDEATNEEENENKEEESLTKQLEGLGFTGLITSKEALDKPYLISDLQARWYNNIGHFSETIEEPAQKGIRELKNKSKQLKGKNDKASKAERKEIKTSIADNANKVSVIHNLLDDEFMAFQQEFLDLIVLRAKSQGYEFSEKKLGDFLNDTSEGLFNEHMIRSYYNCPIPEVVDQLIQTFFNSDKKPNTTDTLKKEKPTNPSADYLDKVVAHLTELYAEGKRPTKGYIQKLQKELDIPNMGMLWEAAELSWLLWYKMLYFQNQPFEIILNQMIHFWNKIQPTYAYSDSSKEIYKQYSTPCPIGAIIAQYTGMKTANSIFEPSAGNGLLLVGADERKTHVNEIDQTRLASLRYQEFKKVTSYNAAKPFPNDMSYNYDVVVTNPPFAKWEDDAYDKEAIVLTYFNNHIGLAKHIRLEHMMTGLALHTMKDTGKAAIIIMGHIYFDKEGYIARYRPFFNWLYRHYHVDDVINMNSFKLYNKQGAVEKTMLILINGRKTKPSGVAPRKEAAPYLEDMVNSFSELWQRVKSHLDYTLELLIEQLTIELKQ